MVFSVMYTICEGPILYVPRGLIVSRPQIPNEICLKVWKAEMASGTEKYIRMVSNQLIH